MIHAKFLRDGAESTVIPVAHITYLTISCEIVPTRFKEAKGIPLFKIGLKLDPGNNRPACILNVTLKILERGPTSAWGIHRTVAKALHGQRFPMPPYQFLRCKLFS